MVFFTTRFVKAGKAGCTYGLLVFIRPEYRGGIGLHSLLYAVSNAYRLAAEVEAYREQARHYPDDRLPLFARAIATKYGLNISADAALKMLKN